MLDQNKRNIAVIGLGYVGLPVACAFAKQHPTIAFDINQKRVDELRTGIDHTGEVTANMLAHPNLFLTSQPDDLQTANFFIIAVPTPVNDSNHPDLTLLLSASKLVGRYLKLGDIVVYESTVYPGATENDCAPILEQASGLACGKDFTLGYSPERINPGDKKHRLETITKIVSGQDQKTLDIIAHVYGSIITAGIYQASSIKTAEAAKVIENTQRDLNIALMNELALIFHKMGIDTQEVIAAASTKWNFLPFKPGLVGGHCIGVDPYYLTFEAQRYGYQPQVILAGRRINDGMGAYIAQQTIKHLVHTNCLIKGARVGVLGVTFKENCSDIRNSKVFDIINELQSYGVTCLPHEAHAKSEAVQHEYGIGLIDWPELRDLNAIILAVPHKEYQSLEPHQLKHCFASTPILIDVKSFLDRETFEEAGFIVWRL